MRLDFTRTCRTTKMVAIIDDLSYWSVRRDNDRLRAALREIIEITKRGSEVDLMLIAIRKCAEHALSK